ncbi:MAG: Hsp20/alpha crystallin family protein [Planctomycetales bacterium]
MSATGSSGGRLPETPVDKLRDVVAGLIDAVTTQGGKAIDSLGLRPGGRQWIPDVDVVERAGLLIVTVNLPGLDPDLVQVTLAGSLLTIQGTTAENEEQPPETVYRRERPTGGFSRTITLPAPVDPDQVRAAWQRGVLTIELARDARHAPRTVPITIQRPTEEG